ncbi:MAG: hypothetical protein R2784_03255 [Saprospiraceae bacterium]
MAEQKKKKTIEIVNRKAEHEYFFDLTIEADSPGWNRNKKALEPVR